MRKDMAKVLVERPRQGGSWGKNGRRDEMNLDPDLSLKQQSMRRGHIDRKSLNENLSPLKAFLGSRVGQHWDKVYSEIHEHMDTSSAVQAHIFQHLWQYVERNVVMVDGVPYRVGHYYSWMGPGPEGLIPLRSPWRGDDSYYIHPKTKVLCKVSGRSRKTQSQKDADARRRTLENPEEPFTWVISNILEYRREDGIWYQVDKTHTTERWQAPIPSFRWKRVNGVLVEPKNPWEWKTRTLTNEKKTQLNKKEIKRLGLNEYQKKAA